MAEGLRAPKETETREASGSRASIVPAIVTSFAASSSTPVNGDDAAIPVNSKDDYSPGSGKPGFLRTSQSFPIGSLPSDIASASSGNPQDARRNSRPVNGRNSASSPTVYETSADASAIDPLSQHIIKRTNTHKSIPLKLLGRASYEAEVRGSPDHASPVEQGPTRGDTVLPQKPGKDKKKGVSFLSRIIGGKKKGQYLEEEDDASEPDTARMDADTAAQPIGFFPRFPRPPKYIRVRAHYKKEKTFNRVFVAQQLEGADDDSALSDKDAPASTTGTLIGKTAGKAVWALVFSNDGRYLAAAGQDGKVRVWAVIASPEDRRESDAEGDGSHDDDEPPPLKAPVFKQKPIQVYEGHTGSVLDLSWSKHSDFVTSIQFHPRDDRFFLAGSLDTKLRLWSIPDKSVAFVATAPDMVTSVAFTPDGRHSIAGCLNGMCNIYETDGLKAIAQIHVRSARGRNAKGSKITGIDTMSVPPGSDAHGEVKLLITSNDSRIRLYNFRDRTLEAKFRGNENTCSQIRASFSDDGKHVICGSEDRRAYLWPTDPSEKVSADKRAVEVLETQSAMVTAAVMAPAKVKQTVGFSEDPIYDICNPPPVTLVNQAEAAGKENGRSNRTSAASRLAQESPTYLSRSTHPDGNIIVVADYSGQIKILRQDCAYHKRRYDTWDTHSTISRRLLRRTNSARHSIASSIGKESSHKTPSERIIAWRNSVIGHHREGSRQGTRTRTPSPHRFADTSRLSSPRPGADSRSGFTTSPPPSAYKSSMDRRTSTSVESARTSADAAGGANGAARSEERKLPASAASMIAQGRDKDNPLWLQGDHSYAFYNRITQDALAAQQRRPPSLLSPNRLSASHRKISTASALSSDYASSHGEPEEGDVLRCDTCQGTNFRATKGRNGKQKLICVRCSQPIS
ncbi:hypothetical protein N8T08_009183 [Aspergillus melleus]|uniref:Uncharacterized protein n=1 Tax=Aspergillus melleus TaxID=138277 RepID=A0ACC3AUG9_9EURO|nr:hypothetical protein N8T08_009183 [Aspergillus melleus]